MSDPLSLLTDAERDYQRMLYCMREQANGWSPLGVQQVGIEEAAQLQADVEKMRAERLRR